MPCLARLLPCSRTRCRGACASSAWRAKRARRTTPQFPTLSESGVPGFTSGGWFGAISPAGMPKDIVAQLNREMNAAMKMPDIREKASILGLDLHTEPPAFFTQTIRDDFDKWGRLARDINFKPQ